MTYIGDASPALGPAAAPDGDAGRAGETEQGRVGWYVVYSKPRKERTAEVQLRLRGVEVFYPRLELPGYVDVRHRIVPMFPGYLFVRIVLGLQFYDVVWAPGVGQFVGSQGVPTPLEDGVIDFLKSNADADGLLRARPTLVVGQDVEITRGPFAGIVGIIQRPPNAKGRIKVLMRLLNRRVVNVELPLQFVKAGWAPSQPASAARVRA